MGIKEQVLDLQNEPVVSETYGLEGHFKTIYESHGHNP
jgi:hypothetical protein